MFRVDEPRSEPRVLHELTQTEMSEDADCDIAIRFVDENYYRELSAKAVSAKRKLRACLHGGGGPQVGEVTRLGGVTRLSI